MRRNFSFLSPLTFVYLGVCGPRAPFLDQVVGVSASISMHPAARIAAFGSRKCSPNGNVEIKNPGGDVVDKRPVVTGEKHRALPRTYRGGEEVASLRV